jgi:FtsP/CotA-like multicopper oxidase with cupredoxin domain
LGRQPTHSHLAGSLACSIEAALSGISAAPKYGTCEIWTLKNGRGWRHPVHIHFEEGQILARNGKASNVPVWEKGRKDLYRLRPSGSVTIKLQFRDVGRDVHGALSQHRA